MTKPKVRWSDQREDRETLAKEWDALVDRAFALDEEETAAPEPSAPPPKRPGEG